jgi:hypothetical protein
MGHILISVLSWPILICVKLSQPVSWSSSLSSHVPFRLGLLVSNKYQQWGYVRLSILPIWLPCLSILPSLNCPNNIKWGTWISKFLIVISSILYILHPSRKQNNINYFWINNKISHYFSIYSISDIEIWDVMHLDNGKRHWSERKSYIYAGDTATIFYVKLKLLYWTNTVKCPLVISCVMVQLKINIF